MAKVVTLRWTSEFDGGGMSRRDRRLGSYEAYLPDPLVGRRFTLTGETAADVADAEAAIIRLGAAALVETEVLSRLLLRAEAVASSRIEGLEIGARRLLWAETTRATGGSSSDVTATAVLANIDAMAAGVDAIGGRENITGDVLLEIHRRLMAGTRIAAHGGRLRDQQNWIGGSSFNPCSADYVPPPPDVVPDLITDLLEFCNGDDLPAVVQAAIAHAQFETIHPFVDGNGRTGRALIHLVLRRRGVALRAIPPVSLVLATWTRSYIDGLVRFRHIGPSTSAAAQDGADNWIAFFASACTRAAADAIAFEEKAASLERGWRELLAPVRAGSATDLLLGKLVGAPIVTVATIADLTGRSYPAANSAVERLVEAGVLRQLTVGRRNRAFESPDVMAAFTDFERRLASPDANTRTSPPGRPVPRRQ